MNLQDTKVSDLKHHSRSSPCYELVQRIVHDFNGSASSHPEIRIGHVKGGNRERFVVRKEQDRVIIDADSPSAAVYGAALLRIVIPSGYLGEYIGEHETKFSLRAVQIEGEETSKFCERVLQLGYNAVILSDDDRENCKEQIFTFHQYGIQTIIKPRQKQKEFVTYIRDLQDAIPDFDYLFWECSTESLFDYPLSFTKDATYADIVAREAHAIESSLHPSKKLIFFLPSRSVEIAEQQSPYFSRICDDVGERTIISFSTEIASQMHPFWNRLQSDLDVSFTPLFPIFSDEWLETEHSCFIRHRFLGAAAMIEHFSGQGEMEECHLWTLSQSLWGKASSSTLFATWLKGHYPDIELEWIRKNFFELKGISRCLQECDKSNDLLLRKISAQIDYLEWEFKSKKQKNQGEHDMKPYDCLSLMMENIKKRLQS